MSRLALVLYSALFLNVLFLLPASAEDKSAEDKSAEVKFEKWYIDPHYSTIRFSVTQLKLRTVRGVFNKCFGQIEFDGSNVSQLKVHAQIDPDSVDTEIKMRDRAIKGDDFLKAVRYPVITFESTRIVPLSKSEFTMYGNLTIRRDTKEVAVDVHGPDTFGKTIAGKTCFTARASAKLNRKDFGMNYSSALISDDVSVLITVRVIEGQDPEESSRATNRARRERTLRIEQHFKNLQEQQHKH